MKKLIRATFNRLGYEIIPKRWTEVPAHRESGFSADFLPLLKECELYTMTSPEKMHALFRAVRYLERNEIEGDVVECGVAEGGSMMLATKTLLLEHSTRRDIYLYDTFSGMPEPTEKDVNYRGDPAMKQWKDGERDGYNEWCYASLETVKKNMQLTQYPTDRIHYLQGKVQDTLPNSAPEKIALLRLDTDWYESTKHELEHLYPRLVQGGVLIIDDYGHWEGCRVAVDEYFGSHPPYPLLNRIDRLGVISVKL